ncbi:MAG: hypothetical protein JNJ59_27825 [Deltaproteobacteria bacterium]|nr:hypothetical protein [Deltaproteobacteria bacterium]
MKSLLSILSQGAVQMARSTSTLASRVPLGLLGTIALAACGEAQAPTATGPGFAIQVAPLSLVGIKDACYELTVFGGTDPTTAPVVWQKSGVCSSQFGDGQGSLAYVGTCDASAGTNTVRLVVEDLCDATPCGPTYPGPNSLDADAWRNPCAAPDGCTLQGACSENADTPITFNLTIARSANQGFFDIGVNFTDIFCSAKLDCQKDDGTPLVLLHDPATGERGPTVVVAWACTAGPDADTHLYYDNLVISCFDAQNQPIGSWPYDPSLGPGNAGPGAAPFVYQTGIYRTETQVNGITSWNVAFGIHPNELPGRCVLTASATASDGALDNQATPANAVYPFIAWDVELSAQAGALTCTQHAVDVPGSGVTTEYTGPKGKVPFSHGVSAKDLERVLSLGQTTCTDTIASLDGGATFTLSPQGLTAKVGDEQSAFYPLPAGLTLQGCCGNPCCGTATAGD